MRTNRMPWRAALGELLVIAVGILLALAVDDWRKDRFDEALAKSYAERVAEDIRADVSEIDRLEAELHVIGDGVSAVMEALDRPNEDPDPMKLRWLVSRTASEFRFDSQRYTYDELISTGNLTLLPSSELRAVLARYYQMTRRLPNADNAWAVETWAEHRRALNEVVDPALLRSISQPLWRATRELEAARADVLSRSVTIDFESEPLTMQLHDMKGDSRYGNSLSTLLQEVSSLHLALREVREAAEAALEALER